MVDIEKLYNKWYNYAIEFIKSKNLIEEYQDFIYNKEVMNSTAYTMLEQ